jgi:type IV pilus assembly protein PilE
MLKNYNVGFSLFELLIALSIAAILTTIAIPSYKHYLQSTYRNEAKITLIRLSAELANYQDQHGSYADVSLATLGWTPKIANRHYYLNLSLSDDNHYEIQAIPQGSQTKDHCGTLSINTSEEKKATGEHCW